MKMWMKGMSQMISGFISSLFGGGAGVMHAGGLVGYDPVPQRQVSLLMFAGAPRLHNGLAPDEYPAILQRGERVQSRAEVAQQGGSGSWEIRIDNRSSQGLAAQTARIDPDSRTVNIIVNDLRTNGPIARALRGM